MSIDRAFRAKHGLEVEGNVNFTGTLYRNGVEFNPGSTLTFTVVSSNTTATPNSNLLVDTSSSSIQVDLPATPESGNYVTFADGGGDKVTQPTIVGRNGNTINGLNEDLNLDVIDHKVTFIYSGSTWRLVNG